MASSTPATPTATSSDLPARSRRGEALGHLQPFALDVCANWREVHEDSSTHLHERALEELHVLQAEGRVILLSAPRAGHGKTHLLGRVAQRMAAEAMVATVPWHTAADVSWVGCGRGVLNDLAAGAAPGIPSLQTACAGVLATLLRRLIQTGRIPSTDPVQALRVLSQDPMGLFKEGGNARVIGDWLRRHFDQLRTPLAAISNLEHQGAVEDRLRAFMDYVDDPSPARLGDLRGKIESDSAEEVPRFLRLLTVWRPLVLVADHMDGLYRDPASGVAVARMTLALTALPGVHVVLSVNQDLWETTFGRQLPSALEDRLNARNITLHGLNENDARELIVLRLRDAGVGAGDTADFLRFLDIERFFFGRPLGSVSARGLLRHASQMWRHWLQAQDAAGALPDTGVTPAEGFLMDPAPAMGQSLPTAPAPAPHAPPPPVPSAEAEEDLQKLAEHLTADAGGRVVSLSSPVPTKQSPMPQAGALLFHAPASPAPLVSPSATPGLPGSPASLAESPTHTAFAATAAEVPRPQTAAPQPEASLATAPDAPHEPAPADGPPNTFHKLREMLAKLKVAADAMPNGEADLPGQDTAQAAGLGANGAVGAPASALQARYEKFRHEIACTQRPSSVEFSAINDLVRLAGRRFAVVNYDEVELPGLLGRSLPRWTLHGMELVFGLEDFSDSRYWKTVSSFMAGRLAELGAQNMGANQGGASQLKLVVFKGDAETAGLVSLLRDESIPPALRNIVDAVHLDPRSLTSLYAMHRIIRETETGALQADTSAVINMLANELDFFWKRVTRPKA